MSYEESSSTLTFRNFDRDLGSSTFLVEYKRELFHIHINLKAVHKKLFSPQPIALILHFSPRF